MKIAIGSDMKTMLTDQVVHWLQNKGYEVALFGALRSGKALWAPTAIEVAQRVASGDFDQGILFCWTGTGITLAANKVKGIRAALCADAETARGARKWNDANILALSIRYTSPALAEEILMAWFDTEVSQDEEDQASLIFLKEFENEK